MARNKSNTTQTYKNTSFYLNVWYEQGDYKILNEAQAKKITKQLMKNGINLIAENNNQIVGLIESVIGMQTKTKHTIYINQMNVKKTYRRQGIANKLMKKLFQIAKKNKIKLLYLHVVSINKPAIKFYEKQGFKITGKIIRQYKFNNKYVDNYIMCKLILK